MSPPESAPAVRMVLAGRVQGVGFRFFTQRAAERLGLEGWVRNLPSGEVEVQVRGTAAALAAFRERLRQGPPGSRVDGVSESELAGAGEWTGFRITY